MFVNAAVWGLMLTSNHDHQQREKPGLVADPPLRGGEPLIPPGRAPRHETRKEQFVTTARPFLKQRWPTAALEKNRLSLRMTCWASRRH
jgi:hypothetical protein